MEPRNPAFRQAVQECFDDARFIGFVGIALVDVGPGWSETKLDLRDDHMQQDGVAHAGVLATLADHSAGAAATTVVGPDQRVLTAEFKINFLRPATGPLLVCRAEVIKPGRTLIVAESEVFSVRVERRSLVAKAMVTLAVVRAGPAGA